MLNYILFGMRMASPPNRNEELEKMFEMVEHGLSIFAICKYLGVSNDTV